MSTASWASSGEDQWTSACPRAVRGGLAAPPRRVAKIGEHDFADMILWCSFLIAVSRATGRRHRRRELQTPSKEGYPSALPAAPPRDTCVPPHLSASIMGASEPSTSALHSCANSFLFFFTS